MTIVAEKPVTGVASTAESIRAKFNYIVDTGVPPVRYIDWPEMAHKAIDPQYQQHEMSVRNGRPLRDTFDIDTHGFVFVDHQTQVRDFTGEAQRTGIYDPEVQALIKKHTGAADVVVFDHTVRVSDEQMQQSLNARPTVKGVHNDQRRGRRGARVRRRPHLQRRAARAEPRSCRAAAWARATHARQRAARARSSGAQEWRRRRCCCPPRQAHSAGRPSRRPRARQPPPLRAGRRS